MTETWLDRLGGRKFAAGALGLICATVALCLGAITAEDWTYLLPILVGITAGTIALEDVGQAFARRGQTPTVAGPETTTPEVPRG